MSFKKYTLQQLATIKYGKNQKAVESEYGSIPIYGTGGLMGYSSKALYDEPSVLIGRKGTIDKVHYVDHPFWTVDTLFYTEINTDIILPRYFYYAMTQVDLAKLNEGTTIPSLRTETLNRIEFNIPSITEQRRRIDLLISLEEKISINDKINQNLEQQLDALYKSWFVDLLPFDGMVPSSWKYGKLKDVLKQKRDSVKPGLYTNLPYLPIDSIPMNSLALNEVRPNEEALSSLVKFAKNDILIGAMRIYFHRVALAPFDGITRTTCFTLEPYNTNYLSFALLVCNQDTSIEYAQKTSKGSTMPYAIWDGGLGDMELLIPSEDDATRFNELALPLLSKIQSSYFENARLQNLRDILLPKLMSGELDVSELDI